VTKPSGWARVVPGRVAATHRYHRVKGSSPLRQSGVKATLLATVVLATVVVLAAV
jgi:hypothetical protein